MSQDAKNAKGLKTFETNPTIPYIPYHLPPTLSNESPWIISLHYQNQMDMMPSSSSSISTQSSSYSFLLPPMLHPKTSLISSSNESSLYLDFPKALCQIEEPPLCRNSLFKSGNNLTSNPDLLLPTILKQMAKLKERTKNLNNIFDSILIGNKTTGQNCSP